MAEAGQAGGEGDLGRPWEELAAIAADFVGASATALGLSARPGAFAAAGRSLAVRSRELCRLGAVVPDLDQLGGKETSPAAALSRLGGGLPPGIGGLLATLGAQYESATAELLSRLAADLPHLSTSKAPALLSLQPGLGDPHDGGRTVTAVELSSGRFFYKTRSPAPELALTELCRLIAGAGAPAVGTPPVIAGGSGWFWQPSITAAEPQPDDRDELARGFGWLLRLLSFLGASDFGAENVLVSRREFVVVDAETLLAPEPGRLPEPASPAGAASAAAERVARVGLLSLPALTPPGLPDLDFGLGAAPTMNWLSCHKEALLAGYIGCHRRLHRARPRIRAALAEKLASLEVRLVVRDTGWYLAAFEHLAARAGRADPGAAVSAARLLAASRSHLSVSPAIADAEMAALFSCDVPRFWLRAADGSLRGPAGQQLGRIDEPPGPPLLRRLEALGKGPGEEELEAVRAALFACQPTATARQAFSAPRRSPLDFSSPTVDRQQLAAPALRAAQCLATHLLGAGRHPSLYGLSYNRGGRLFALRPLGGELLSGTGGLAVVLTEAAEVGRARRAGRELLSLLEDRARWAAAASLDWIDRALQRPGRAVDVAESLRALSRVSTAPLQEDQLVGEALATRACVLAEHTRRLLAARGPKAGAAQLRAAEAVLVALRTINPSGAAEEAADEETRLLLEAFEAGRPAGGDAGTPRSGLDSLQGGFLASFTLPAGLVGAIEGRPDLGWRAGPALTHDQQMAKACASRWGPPLELAFAQPWRRPGRDSLRPAQAAGWVETASVAGLLFLVDLALLLLEHSPPAEGAAWLAVGLAAGDRLARGWEQRGSFFAEQLGSPRFSFSAVWGEAAGVHALFRLASPGLGPLRLALQS